VSKKKKGVGVQAREQRLERDRNKAEEIRALAQKHSLGTKQKLIEGLRTRDGAKKAISSSDAVSMQPVNRPETVQPSYAGNQLGTGKTRRRCIVCGKKKMMWSHERMCIACRVLPAAERKVKRAQHGGGRRRSIYTVSGGLPSLGKHN
jgi:hypothetical protein